jgi:hypothetical protein
MEEVMNIEKWNSIVCRIFFLAAFILVALAILDRFMNLFGYTVLSSGYTSGRMLELAALMLVLVIALLLRQIREGLRRSAG